MKSVFVFFCLGIFFLLLTLFLVNNFPPFNLDKVNEVIQITEVTENSPEDLSFEIKALLEKGLIWEYLSSNAYLVFFSICLTVFFIVCTIHLFVDKVFFKSLWQSPSLLLAVRRASLFTLSVGVMIYLKFLKVEDFNIVLVPFTAILIELTLSNIKIGQFFIKRAGNVEVESPNS